MKHPSKWMIAVALLASSAWSEHDASPPKSTPDLPKKEEEKRSISDRTEKAIRYHIKSLSDADPEVRINACEMLLQISTRDGLSNTLDAARVVKLFEFGAVEALIQVLDADREKHQPVRLASHKTLVTITKRKLDVDDYIGWKKWFQQLDKDTPYKIPPDEVGDQIDASLVRQELGLIEPIAITTVAYFGDGGTISIGFKGKEDTRMKIYVSGPLAETEDSIGRPEVDNIYLRKHPDDGGTPAEKGGKCELALCQVLMKWVRSKATEDDLARLAGKKSKSSEERHILTVSETAQMLKKRQKQTVKP